MDYSVCTRVTGSSYQSRLLSVTLDTNCGDEWPNRNTALNRVENALALVNLRAGQNRSDESLIKFKKKWTSPVSDLVRRK